MLFFSLLLNFNNLLNKTYFELFISIQTMINDLTRKACRTARVFGLSWRFAWRLRPVKPSNVFLRIPATVSATSGPIWQRGALSSRIALEPATFCNQYAAEKCAVRVSCDPVLPRTRVAILCARVWWSCNSRIKFRRSIDSPKVFRLTFWGLQENAWSPIRRPAQRFAVARAGPSYQSRPRNVNKQSKIALSEKKGSVDTLRENARVSAGQQGWKLRNARRIRFLL